MPPVSGVLIEASSPALIETARTATTDGTGRCAQALPRHRRCKWDNVDVGESTPHLSVMPS